MTEAKTSSLRRKQDAFARQEFPFTPGDFKRIAAMFRQDAGIAMGEIKAPLVYARLVKRLRALGLENFAAYCEHVESRGGTGEREHMIAALTTNVTRFMREPHHFEHLKTKVLPGLVDGVRRGGSLRIWSAGCSTGEEPYSIALTVLSVLPDAMRYDVKILATDINKDVLAFGRKGVYSKAAVAPLSREQRAQWFVTSTAPNGETTWRAGEALGKLVSFRELNLMSAWPMRQLYQAIFCRNVAIYFEDDAQTEIWTRLAGLLAPSGCLYVGHSERVAIADKFSLDGCTTYRLNDRQSSVTRMEKQT
jgi:chemotaxis protein methyltransferase CheR